MAARLEAIVKHGFSQEEIAKVVEETLLFLLMDYRQSSPGIFEAAGFESKVYFPIPMTLHPNTLIVDVTGEGIIEIASEPKRKTVMGVPQKGNPKEIIKFLTALKRELSESELAKSKPEAYSEFLAAAGSDVKTASVYVGGGGCCSLLAMSIIIIPAGIGVLVCALVIIAHIPRG